MSFENFPSGNTPAPEQNPAPQKKDYRSILTGVLFVALLGTIGYIIWDKNQSRQREQQLTMQITSSDSSKNQIQTELNDAVRRLDELKTTNAKADSLIGTKNQEIEGLKARIQTIINNKNATAAELREARGLINQLKQNINTYTAEIERLKGENLRITEEKRVVTEERDVVRRNFDSARGVIKEKEDIIDVGSTLHASNFTITGIKERGSKEKETTTAKRVDKLRISFVLDENRITQSGPKDVYVSITAPDGTPVAVEALGSGKFVLRDGTEKLYTKKMQVNYTQGEKQNITVEWKQNSPFQTGDYRIEVYNNGFKIGEGVRNFKKGGLFS